MGITPSQLLGLDYVWRGAPRVRLASPSLDTLALDLAWRGAPLVADALEPEPVSLWASPLIELEGAAEAQVVQSLWGAGAVSLFGATATLATTAEVRAGGALRVEGEAEAGMDAGLVGDASATLSADAYAGLATTLGLDALLDGLEAVAWLFEVPRGWQADAQAGAWTATGIAYGWQADAMAPAWSTTTTAGGFVADAQAPAFTNQPRSLA